MILDKLGPLWWLRCDLFCVGLIILGYVELDSLEAKLWRLLLLSHWHRILGCKTWSDA